MLKNNNVVIMGLGYVGLTLAVTMAECGFNVFGYEQNEKIREKLKKNKAHFFEPNLQSKLAKQIRLKKLKIINEIKNNNIFDTYIVSVGTPLTKNNTPDLSGIISVTKTIAKKMHKNSLIIYRSTIPPGTSEKKLIPILNKSGIDYDFCFCPERTAQGVALKELRKMPQIIGGINKRSSNKALKIFKRITTNTKVVSNLTTAEMIKCVDNTQRDTKFAYANEIANICNSLNINAREVLNTAHDDYPRTSLFLPGPVGGPCLSKDSYLLLSSVNKKLKKNSVIISSRKTNENLINEFKLFLLSNLKNKLKPLNVLILGLTFKGYPKTDDMRGSISIDLINYFKKNNVKNKIFAYDKFVNKKSFKKLDIIEVKNLKKSFYHMDLVVIANNNLEFRKINLSKEMLLLNKNALVYDFWNFYRSNRYVEKNKSNYVAFGNHISLKND